MPLTLNVLSVAKPNGDALITRISTAADGTQGNDGSYSARVSADGHFVMFESDATNLGAGTVAGVGDLFRKNLLTGTVELISAGLNGAAANHYSYNVSSSANGNQVAFESRASNLVVDDNGGFRDIFVKDFSTSTLVCITAGANEDSFNARLTSNGRYVFFESYASNLIAGDTTDTANTLDHFLKDLMTGAIVRLDAPAESYYHQISDDGRYLTFESDVDNLVAGDTNGLRDIFRKDLQAGTIQRLTVNPQMQSAPDGSSFGAQFSADGRYMVFESSATNFVAGDTNGKFDVFRKDLVTGEVVRVSTGAHGESNGGSYTGQISADGRYVTFESTASNLVDGDTNGHTDIFRKDMITGALERVSITTMPAQGKVQGNGSSYSAEQSADGRYAIFTSSADNLASGDNNHVSDIFRRDLATGEIVRVSVGSGGESNNYSNNAQTSADGRYVAFESDATNLAEGHDPGYSQHIFVRDLLLGTTVRVSANADGTVLGNNSSSGVQISADGHRVVFDSGANNLLAGDTNDESDIFLRDMSAPTHTLVRVSTGANQVQADSASYNADLSADGNMVVFESNATNLVGGDSNGVSDIFLKDMRVPNLAPILVSSATDGTQANDSSSDARVNVREPAIDVVFTSSANNLVGVGADTNGVSDIFLYRQSGATSSLVRVSTGLNMAAANGASYSAEISADGHYVVFASIASNLVANDTNGTGDIFVKDLNDLNAAPILVSTGLNGQPADGYSSNAQISIDGRYVTFESYAGNLVIGDTNGTVDVFRKDLHTGTIERLSALTTDAQGRAEANSGSYNRGMTADGRFVLIDSSASNLVPGDTNAQDDVFLIDAARLPDLQAMRDGRFIELKLGVGAASRVDMAWGDGTSGTATIAGGVATLSHAYAAKGAKDSLISVHEGEQTWAVHYALDVASGALSRNTALADTLSGGSGADVLTGDEFGNRLVGNGGNDTLDGAAGADTMEGGAGDDTYRLDSASDVIVEAAGGGTDTAIVSFDFAMGGLTGVEVVRLAEGTAASKLTGGAGSDRLIGNSSGNAIDGGSGADTMEGGAGSDVFVVDNASDVVVESAGGGMDAVKTSVSFSLSAAAEVEMLTAMGAGALQLTGSNTANTIRGNGAANGLNGLGGDDKLYGGLGKDVLAGGAGRDIFVFDSKPNKKTNLDKVTDFSVKDDSIWLDNAVMGKLGRKGSESKPVKLSKAFFALDKAKDGNDHIVYVKKTGALYYDVDGSGAKAAVQIATLSKKLKMTYADFFVV